MTDEQFAEAIKATLDQQMNDPMISPMGRETMVIFAQKLLEKLHQQQQSKAFEAQMPELKRKLDEIRAKKQGGGGSAGK